ncbi:hypothetical protein NITMOv2_1510 [Nitrospira moscoviensis]|uniref:Uncharacterized protein n=1 Tax=Nitrospira moscoviensis TaxID=42253 RepID=A0A0K2GAE8_NITMO|nr:hypothetical protein NITMOv2_1510 [Nitrospira moscoviensis]
MSEVTFTVGNTVMTYEMPKGVEHQHVDEFGDRYLMVMTYEMPKGVEHKFGDPKASPNER